MCIRLDEPTLTVRVLELELERLRLAREAAGGLDRLANVDVHRCLSLFTREKSGK